VGFRAFLATRRDGTVATEVTELDDSDLPPGDVLVEVEYSGLNFKDAMAVQPGNRVARTSPLVPGVDLAGRVLDSADPALAPGTAVLAHGHDLGVSRHGGFAQRARVPSGWVLPLPADLDTRRAMIIGTAGFTAQLSIDRLRQAGVAPDAGPVLVTGASGGVGSTAVALLAGQGFEVVASTGKTDQHEYLRSLGADDVIGRDVAGDDGSRTLGAERWAAAVDCVGGRTLADVLRTLRYRGAVAASGLTAGPELATSVYPFIIRAVSLMGVDSVQTPLDERREIWQHLAHAVPASLLEDIVSKEIGLDELQHALSAQIAGEVRGRVLLRP
jgi:acrylyl-CoA reductase (NADPH)